MKYNFRLFFKELNASPQAKTCKNIELKANKFDQAVVMGQNIAQNEKLRLVMVAELPE